METDLELTFSLQASTFAVWLWILTLARQFRDKQGGVEAVIWRVSSELNVFRIDAERARMNTETEPEKFVQNQQIL